MGKGFLLGLAVGLVVGIFAMISPLLASGSSWPFSADAMLQSVAALLGAGAAFLGISWQIREAGRNRKLDRRERQRQIANAIGFEVEHNLSTAREALSPADVAERATKVRMFAVMLLSDAYERLSDRLDDLEMPGIARLIKNHHLLIAGVKDFIKLPGAEQSIANNALVHRMEVIEASARQILDGLSQLAGRQAVFGQQLLKG